MFRLIDIILIIEIILVFFAYISWGIFPKKYTTYNSPKIEITNQESLYPSGKNKIVISLEKIMSGNENKTER